jgi:hypothetical protein
MIKPMADGIRFVARNCRIIVQATTTPVDACWLSRRPWTKSVAAAIKEKKRIGKKVSVLEDIRDMIITQKRQKRPGIKSISVCAIKYPNMQYNREFTINFSDLKIITGKSRIISKRRQNTY